MRQLICTFVLFLIAGAGSAQPAPTPEAAWQKVSEAMRPPTRPANTKGRLMTALEMQAFRALQAETSRISPVTRKRRPRAGNANVCSTSQFGAVGMIGLSN
ncbi:MAG: hypothetical protein ACKVHO_23770 [Verrucomicrobiia bacterium]